MEDFIIKVCGVTTVEDAQAAVDAGANALGFNFYAASPRFVTVTRAAEIISAVKGSYLRVGVFVNSGQAEVRAIASEAGLDVVQMHGETAPLAGVRCWRAMHAGETVTGEGVEAYLMDTFTPKFGGSGATFDWSLVADFSHRTIVAGGLDAGNVGEAIRVAGPWGVDSCSRLESAPGRKDWEKTRAFVRAARGAFSAR